MERSISVSEGGCVVREPARIHVVPSQSERWAFDASDVHDLCASDDEVWLIGGTPPALTRMRFADGAVIAQPIIVSARVANSRLIASPVPGIAVWHGDDLIEIDGRTGKARTEVLGREGLALPFQVGRCVAIDKRNIRFISGSVTRWESRQMFDPDLTVLDGCVIAGGKQVAIVLGRGTPRSVIVLDAFTGALRRRLGLRDVLDVRFAPRHHLVALRAHGDRVLVLDLETTQVHTIFQGGMISDVAISANGKTVALLDVAGEGLRIQLGIPRKSTSWATVTLTEPAACRAPAAPEPGAAQAEPSAWVTWSDTAVESPSPAPEPPAEVVPPDPESASTAEQVAPVMHGLRPRVAAARAPAGVARSLLELQLRAVASWCELAIAQAADADLAHVREEGVTYVRRLQGVIAGAAATGERTQIAQRHVRGSMLNLHRARKELGPGRIPIDDLAHDFGLSPLAVDILLVVAAPVLWGELAEVYAMLSGERGRAVCHELLICRVLGFPPGMRHEIATELDARAPLVRRGLVHVSNDRPRPFATLAPEPLVIDRIRDLPIDRKPDEWARPYVTETILEDVIAPADAIERALAAFGRPPDEPGVRVVVCGRRGSGRRTLLAALAARAGRIVGEIDTAVFAGSREHVADQLAGELRRAAVRGWLPCVSGLDVSRLEEAERARVRRVLDDHAGPLVLRLEPESTPPLSPGYTIVELPMLEDQRRATFWASTAARHGLEVADLGALSRRYRVGPGVISRAAAAVAGTVEAPTDRALSAAVQQYIEDRLGEVAQRVRDLAAWSDLVLSPDVHDSLRELISRIRWAGLVYEQWGFAGGSGRTRGVTALFHGVPGTGKTMAAGVIARELGVDLYRVDLSRVVSKWVGETERNLAAVFAAAEESQAIILFDEADSLFARRTEIRSSADRYANLEVNYILQRLDSFDGIAILTSNHLGAIDPAFRRRLTVEVNFPFPDDETRALLWHAHLPRTLPDRDQIDIDDLARRYKLSGGYIRNAALRAAFLAAAQGVTPTHDHVERAIRLQYSQAGTISSGGVLE